MAFLLGLTLQISLKACLEAATQHSMRRSGRPRIWWVLLLCCLAHCSSRLILLTHARPAGPPSLFLCSPRGCLAALLLRLPCALPPAHSSLFTAPMHSLLGQGQHEVLSSNATKGHTTLDGHTVLSHLHMGNTQTKCQISGAVLHGQGTTADQIMCQKNTTALQGAVHKEERQGLHNTRLGFCVA